MTRRNDPMRRRRAELAAALGDELPAQYYDRAVAMLMEDENEQRDFVHSEFFDRGLIRLMIARTVRPDDAHVALRQDFAAWLRDHRKFRVTTMAWALYAADHPTQHRQ